jgi:ABC-type multidrug transport system ATPase subunit
MLLIDRSRVFSSAAFAGFLGVNGAGKTTTLQMCVGLLIMTAGRFDVECPQVDSRRAAVAGRCLPGRAQHPDRAARGSQENGCGRAQMLGSAIARKSRHACAGYCPQFDALIDLMTGREHLQLFSRIKGVAEPDVPLFVDAMIARMGELEDRSAGSLALNAGVNRTGLAEYADKPCGGYSGGNKRKLCVAIALIGKWPACAELVSVLNRSARVPRQPVDRVPGRALHGDGPQEPPLHVARDRLHHAGSLRHAHHAQASRALRWRPPRATAHGWRSMDEAEALCGRIGIMVGGRLRCIGSAQRLRHRYGEYVAPARVCSACQTRLLAARSGYQLEINTGDKGTQAAREFVRQRVRAPSRMPVVALT